MKFPKQVLQEFKTAQRIGTGLSLFEIEDESGEYHVFHLAQSENYYFIGGVCNAGMLLDAWREKDDTFSEYEHLQRLHEICEDAVMNEDGILITAEDGEVH